MAKKKQHIDEFFKEQLRGQELPLDGSEWSRLSSDLQPKKKRRFLLWWLLLIPAIALSVLFYLKSNNNDTHLTPEVKASQKQQSTTNSSDGVNPNQEAIAQLDKNSNESIVENQNTNTSISASSSEASIESTSQNNQNNESGRDIQTQQADIESTEDNSSSTSESSETLPSAENLDIINRYNEQLLLLQSIGLNSIPYTIIKPELESANPEKIKVKKQAPPVFGPIYLSFDASANVNQQTINSDTAIQYAEYRNANENLSLTPQLSIGINTEFKNLMIGTGVSYVKKQQVLGANFNSSPELRILLYDSVAFVDINLDTTWLPFNYRDSVLRTSNSQYSLTAPSYHYIGIPLYVSKRLELTNNFSLDLGLQLQSQFAVANSGTVNSLKLKAKELGMDDINRFNLNAGLQLGINYEFNPGFIIQLNTGIRQDLLNMSATEGIQQRFSLYGTGIRFYYRIN